MFNTPTPTVHHTSHKVDLQRAEIGNVNSEKHVLVVEPPMLAAASPVDAAVIIGHRGMGVSHSNPANPYTENTRASFLAAYTAGARWVEIDILPSADGDLMLLHDHFLAIDGATRPVWTVPTQRLLDEGIEPLDGLCNDLPDDLGLYLELKVTPGDVSPRHGSISVDPLLEWVHANARDRPILVASFNPFTAARANQSGLQAGWITNKSQRLHTSAVIAAQAGVSTLVVHGNSLEAPEHELVLALHVLREHNIRLWSYSPNMNHLSRYHDMGVTGFCVDDVAQGVATFA